jgi:hypothetical protein
MVTGFIHLIIAPQRRAVTVGLNGAQRPTYSRGKWLWTTAPIHPSPRPSAGPSEGMFVAGERSG